MAKVQQKSEKITAFDGLFFVSDKFVSMLSRERTVNPASYLPPICLRCNSYFQSVKCRCTTAASEDSAEKIQILL